MASGWPLREHIALLGHTLASAQAGRFDAAEAALQAVRSHPFHAVCRWHHWLAGLIEALLAPLPAEAQRAAWQDIAQQLDRFTTADAWVGPNELLLCSAMRPGVEVCPWVRDRWTALNFLLLVVRLKRALGPCLALRLTEPKQVQPKRQPPAARQNR